VENAPSRALAALFILSNIICRKLAWLFDFTIEHISREDNPRGPQTGHRRRESQRMTEIVEARKLPCAGCHLPCGIDCRYVCAYIFGRVDVSETLPLEFAADEQFSLQIPVVIEGKHFGKKTVRTFWFNSVRCAELFLMENGYCKVSKAVIGNGERLLSFPGGPRSPRLAYPADLWSISRRRWQDAPRHSRPSILGLWRIDSKGQLVQFCRFNVVGFTGEKRGQEMALTKCGTQDAKEETQGPSRTCTPLKQILSKVVGERLSACATRNRMSVKCSRFGSGS
jgi:hypothetical protein